MTIHSDPELAGSITDRSAAMQRPYVPPKSFTRTRTSVHQTV